jgi:hypothetical protein
MRTARFSSGGAWTPRTHGRCRRAASIPARNREPRSSAKCRRRSVRGRRRSSRRATNGGITNCRVWGGRYRGQAQKWFALRFTGQDADIDLTATPHVEFDAWQWVALDRLVDLIVPFKRDVYLEVVDEFAPLIRGAAPR